MYEMQRNFSVIEAFHTNFYAQKFCIALQGRTLTRNKAIILVALLTLFGFVVI